MATIVSMGTGGGLWRKWKLIAVVVVLLAALATGAVIGARWWQQYRKDQQAATPKAIAQVGVDMQKQVAMGNYAKAHEIVNRALDNPRLTPDAKFNLYIQQGAIYETQKKYDDAMASFRKAEAIHQNLSVDVAIADLAYIMGNKPLAIEYYKKAIPLVPDGPRKDQTKQNYQNLITGLEGGTPDAAQEAPLVPAGYTSDQARQDYQNLMTLEGGTSGATHP